MQRGEKRGRQYSEEEDQIELDEWSKRSNKLSYKEGNLYNTSSVISLCFIDNAYKTKASCKIIK